MNSVRELRSTYDQHNIRHGIRNSSSTAHDYVIQPNIGYENVVKTAATTYDFPDHSADTCPSSSLPAKKDNATKKWSLGSLFFRRKKRDDSESSSNEEATKQRNGKEKNKKSDSKKQRKNKRSYFDHIVIPPPNKNRSLPNYQQYVEEHDSSYMVNRPLPKVPKDFNKTSAAKITLLDRNNSADSLSKSSPGRRSRKELTKQRAVARRDSLTRGESSDEDSQRSHSSSKIKSDDSLSSRTRDSSLNRRTRNARTERYIKRLSKDEESILNREALQRQARENWQIKLNNYDLNGYPVKNDNSGLFTVPPSRFDAYTKPSSIDRSSVDEVDNMPSVSAAFYSNNDRHSNTSTCFNLRSWSCESNMHEIPSPEVPRKNRSIRTSSSFSESPQNYYRNIVRYKQPPPPPPRDPKRITDPRPISGISGSNNHVQDINARRYFYNNGCHRTASEDQINVNGAIDFLHPRPASASHETRPLRRLISQRSEPLAESENYKYLTEKKARSRKPIFIQSTDRINMQNNMHLENSSKPSAPQWRTKPIPPPSSPTQMFTAQTTNVLTKIYLPNGAQNITQSQINDPNDTIRNSSPFKPIAHSFDETVEHTTKINASDPEPDEEKRKSANLEEALDELEAIYKSLHLGDDDLLERAEEREISLAAKKMIEKNSESYPLITVGTPSRPGNISDSSFNYEPFNTNKNFTNRSARTLDRKCDDMAFRKLNKTTTTTNTVTNRPKNSPVNNISYLLASPVHSRSPDDLEVEALTCKENEEEFDDDKEPDVTLDDVVYRTIRHCNNTLKVIDPQPPFGIPIGPVTQAPASDYLHASPSGDSSSRRSRTPDIVKDDLAFRNLRKDSNKEPALMKCVPIENCTNRNHRHNRAVRSLSANISNILNRPQIDYPYNPNDVENEFNTTSLSDIADAMEIARQILKEKENGIISTKRAFLSDSDTKYYRNREKHDAENDSSTECRQNFLNNMLRSTSHHLSAKPPVTPRGSTPEYNDDKEIRSSSFEELLTALTVEAKETNERIKTDLRCSSTNKKLNDIENVSKSAKLTCEKILECVAENTNELIAPTAQTAESYPLEEVEDRLEPIPPPLESVANIITTGIEEDEEEEEDFDLFDKCIIDDGNENQLTAKDSAQETYNKSPFEEHRADLIARFKELDKFETDDKSEHTDESQGECINK